MKFKRFLSFLLIFSLFVLSAPVDSFADVSTPSESIGLPVISPFSISGAGRFKLYTSDYSRSLTFPSDSFTYTTGNTDPLYTIMDYYIPVKQYSGFTYTMKGEIVTTSHVTSSFNVGYVFIKYKTPDGGLTDSVNVGSLRVSGNKLVFDCSYAPSGQVSQFLLSITTKAPFPAQWSSSISLKESVKKTTDSSDSGMTSQISSGVDSIEENTSELVNQQNQTNGLLANIIQTISNQLTAFWNQLAGEFTNLYDKMNNQHQENLDKMDDQTDSLTENADKNTNIITGALEKLGNFLIDGLKHLFIPSDTFFKVYFDDLYSWFSDRLGFLSFPIDLLVMLVNMFLGSSSTDFIITLPSFQIMGEQLLTESSFNLTEFLNVHFAFLLTAIRFGVSVVIVFGFVKLCEKKWEEVMMN